MRRWEEKAQGENENARFGGLCRAAMGATLLYVPRCHAYAALLCAQHCYACIAPRRACYCVRGALSVLCGTLVLHGVFHRGLAAV